MELLLAVRWNHEYICRLIDLAVIQQMVGSFRAARLADRLSPAPIHDEKHVEVESGVENCARPRCCVQDVGQDRSTRWLQQIQSFEPLHDRKLLDPVLGTCEDSRAESSVPKSCFPVAAACWIIPISALGATPDWPVCSTQQMFPLEFTATANFAVPHASSSAVPSTTN